MPLPGYERIQALSNEERLGLIKKWSQWFYDHTESFEGELGMQLAYLWAAIANAHQIEVYETDPVVMLLISKQIKKDDIIWDFIDVVREFEEEKPRRLFNVLVREVHLSHRMVLAKDREEAICLADKVDEHLSEYHHTMSKDTWTVEEATE